MRTNGKDLRTRILSSAEMALTGLLGSPVKTTGDEWIYHAFYRTDHNPSLHVNVAKQCAWIDRGTGQGGNLFDLAGLWFGLNPQSDFREILDKLAGLAGISETSRKQLPVATDTDALARQYGLEWSDFERHGCKVVSRAFKESQGEKIPTVAYPLETLSGKSGYKYRSVQRLGKGNTKRLPNCDPGAKGFFPTGQTKGSGVLYVTGGEEKALALLKCKVRAVSTSTGETGLSADMAASLVADGNAEFVLAMDGDASGQSANKRAAKLLFAAGAQSVSILPMPADCDVNDIIKQRGVEGLTRLLSEARRVSAESQEASAIEPFPEPSHSDMANASRFVAQHGADVRYVRQWGWVIWDEQRWNRTNGDLNAQERAKDTARRIYAEAAEIEEEHERKASAKWAAHSANRRQLESMLALARSDARVLLDADAFDREPMLLCVSNGEVDLRTGQLLPHRRESYCSKLTPISYRPGAKSAEWESLLGTVFGSDAELIAFMQKVVGYILTGETREQCFFIAHGEGQNGKSTFVETLLALLGDYGIKTTAETFLEQKHPGIRNDLARLCGARFVSGVETGKDRRLAVTVLKELSGQDSITARFLHKEFFTFQPEFKIVIATNYRPRIDDTGEAIWRRIRLIPFNVRIPDAKRDNGLPDRLRSRENLEGILAWAVQGAMRWAVEGLKDIPAAVVEATAAYRQEEDAFERFLADSCAKGPNHKVQARHLLDAFNAWAELHNERRVSSTALSRILRDRGLCARKGTGGYMVYDGLALSVVRPEVVGVERMEKVEDILETPPTRAHKDKIINSPPFAQLAPLQQTGSHEDLA